MIKAILKVFAHKQVKSSIDKVSIKIQPSLYDLKQQSIAKTWENVLQYDRF